MTGRSIFVNGVEITEHAVRVEAQYHPAAGFEQAEHEARRALVVRQLFLTEATRLGRGPTAETEDATMHAIDALVQTQVPVPDVGIEQCAEYYATHRERFQSPSLFEAAHILVAVTSTDEREWGDARARAEQLVAELQRSPDRFERLAREHSACSTATRGGNLGQVTRGETDPAFEACLERMEPGQLCSEPVRTRFGYHVVQLLDKRQGRVAPFETVAGRIQVYLRDTQWRQDLLAYIERLAGAADIVGYSFDEPVPVAEARPRPRRKRSLPVISVESPAASATPAPAEVRAPRSLPVLS